ncbi:MAG: rod shape-determining protein MreC [Vicinamibacteria bacterium]|nr:rod shape-determining protein MreC [Vicinamibacteria bacterium]
MIKVVDTRRSLALLALLVLGHLVAISRQVEAGGGSTLFDRVLLSALTPLSSATAAAVRGVAEAWHGYVDLRGVRADNARLREQVGQLEMLLQRKQDAVRESERLHALLALRETLPLETVSAHVISRDGTPWFSTLTVDRGFRDGVRLNAPVLSSTGVVGRVTDLAPAAARVQVVLDANSGIGAVIERTRVAGVVSGQVRSAEAGRFDLRLKYVPSLADAVVGDLVVTSGLDRIFPRGLVIGRVSAVGPGSGLFKEIALTPAARLESLEEVLIATGERPAVPVFAEGVR